MRAQFNLSPTPSNWPPFEMAELPPQLVGELESILKPLYLATLELHRTAYRYEIMAALGRGCVKTGWWPAVIFACLALAESVEAR
jgi:hypothetical protein